jgi:hypothetical protein
MATRDSRHEPDTWRRGAAANSGQQFVGGRRPPAAVDLDRQLVSAGPRHAGGHDAQAVAALDGLDATGGQLVGGELEDPLGEPAVGASASTRAFSSRSSRPSTAALRSAATSIAGSASASYCS